MLRQGRLTPVSQGWPDDDGGICGTLIGDLNGVSIGILIGCVPKDMCRSGVFES